MNDLVFSDMVQEDIYDVISLIAKAMNENEGKWADQTIKFHFFCKKNRIDDGRRYFVARRNNQIVGITGIHVYSWGPQDSTWLGWFAVEPEYHGQKIGYHLMNHTISLASKAGYRRLLVETYSDDDFEKARRFYERYGFKNVGMIKDYIRTGVDMVVFGLDL